MDNYLNLLNDTSLLFQIMDSMIYIKVLSYYDIINNEIQNKFEQIESTALRTLGKSESNGNFFSNLYNKTRNQVKKSYNYYQIAVKNHEEKFMAQYNEYYDKYYQTTFDYINNKIDLFNQKIEDMSNSVKNYLKNTTFVKNLEDFGKYLKDKSLSIIKDLGNKLKNTTFVKALNKYRLSLESKMKKLFGNFSGNTSFIDKVKNVYNKTCNISYNFPEPPFKMDYPFPVMFIPAFPFLQVRIIPYVFLGAHFGTSCYKPKFDIGLFVDMNIMAEISLSLEVGIYIPGTPTPSFELSVKVGIKGVLFSGKVGVGINLYFTKKTLEIDLYSELRAFEYYAYALYRIKIDLKFYNLDKSFPILEKYFPNMSKEKHKILQYKIK